MPVINTNVKAVYTQTAMKATERASGVAMQQLSTGKRINSAKDDAAGLAIATRMTQQIRSLNQAMRNAGDAVSLMQTAEGATSEITNMLQRMRELSIQAINDTNADEQRGYLDTEFQQLKQEIVRIADTTEWNGFPILNGTSGERVGERPVYKATSAGTFSGAITYTASAVTASTGTATIASGSVAKAGSVTVTVPAATALFAGLTPGNGTNTFSLLVVALPALDAGKSVTVDGLTFTATAAMTATQVGAAFTSIAAGGTTGSSTSLGTYSGALSANWAATSTNVSGFVAFRAAAYGTVTNTMSASSADRDATAVLTLPDGTQNTFTGLASGNKITFTSSPLTNGTGSLVLSATAGNTGSTLSFSSARTFTPVAAMAANDVIINGVTIGVSYAASDNGKSPAGSAAASAIARAATINQNFADTNVAAVVNTNVLTGSAMGTGLSAATGTVTVNGYTSAPITTVLNNTRESRANVVAAINAISFQTGVVAINSNNDNQGVRLEAADGRNIELAFNTASSTSAFEARTGLKEGLQIGSYSLETSVEGQLEVTTLSTGDWTRAGLKPASYTTNQAVINTGIRPLVTSAANIKALGDGDLVINGVAIRATVAADDLHSDTTALTSSAAASAIAIANAINSHHADTGVTAKASSVSTSGSYTTTTAVDGTYSLFINGQNVQVALLAADTDPERLTKVVDAINGSFGQHGALATNNGTGGITLTTPDGRNLSIWTATDPSEFGLAVSASAEAEGVTFNVAATSASYTGASTLYGSVSLIANPAPKQPPPGAAPSNGAPPPYVSKTFTVEAGVNGFNASTGDFASLGFQAGTFGGDVSAADSKMTPPRTGRLSFHVGASANQTITIDLSDFGKDGPITGEITGDSDKSPATVHINDREAAKTVLAKLDRAMDKVNGTRATMGAVMNRLEHVIDNLTNVAMNSEASRSQIEDADYAIASTELSRTQIMQQAATAVLAQANTSQQTVLKLLQ
jgi:flagellin